MSSYLLRSKLLGGHVLSNVSFYAFCLFLISFLLLYKTGDVLSSFRWSRADTLVCIYSLFVIYSFVISVDKSFSMKYILNSIFYGVLLYFILKEYISVRLHNIGLMFILFLSPVFLSVFISPVFRYEVGNISGIFSNKNSFGFFASIVSSFLIFFFYNRGLLFTLVSVPSMLLVLLSGCRTAVFALIVVLSLFCLYLIMLGRYRLLSVLSLILVFMFVAMSLKYSRYVREKLSVIFHPASESSVVSRFHIYRSCLNVISFNKYVGFGFGNVNKVICKDISNVKQEFGIYYDNFCSGGCHNMFLECMLQGGVIGAIYVLCFYSYVFYILFLFFFKRCNICLAVACSLLSIAVFSITEVAMFSKMEVVRFLLLSLASCCELYVAKR